MATANPHNREIVWRRIMDDASFEHARVMHTNNGIELSGTILAVQTAKPLRVDYTLRADSQWRSRSLSLVQDFDGQQRSRTLDRRADGRWLLDGVEAAELDACVDIDLGLSPITNALPVNRLGLAVSGSVEIDAAWVLFPQLTVERAMQRYERVAEMKYRYTSVSSGFTAVIDVDAEGFPVEYGGVWRMLAGGV